MAVTWITALKMIPWGDVVQNAPTVLRTAKKLWGMVGTAAAERAPDRIALLESELAQLKSVVVSLAEQNARLVEAVDILRVRTRILLITCGVLVVGTLALAAAVFIR